MGPFSRPARGPTWAATPEPLANSTWRRRDWAASSGPIWAARTLSRRRQKAIRCSCGSPADRRRGLDRRDCAFGSGARQPCLLGTRTATVRTGWARKLCIGAPASTRSESTTTRTTTRRSWTWVPTRATAGRHAAGQYGSAMAPRVNHHPPTQPQESSPFAVPSTRATSDRAPVTGWSRQGAPECGSGGPPPCLSS